jgi:hypothetical protein
VYAPQSYLMNLLGSESGVTFGMTARIAKMGSDNTAGSAFRVDNLHVQSAVFEFPAGGGWPTVTWTVVGSFGVQMSGVGLTPIAIPAGLYAVKPGDLGRDPSHAILPSISERSAGTRNVNTIRWTINNGVDYPPRWANDYDVATMPRPGKEGKVTVEGAYSTFVEQTFADIGPGEVYWEWVGSSFNGLYIRHRAISAVSGATHSSSSPLADSGEDVPYAIDFLMPLAALRDAQAPIGGPGTLQMDFTVRGFVGPTGTTGAETALTTDLNVPAVIQMLVAEGDDGDAKYNDAADGGNIPHSSLNV